MCGAGRGEGHWAPNGCWVMERLFRCLCIGVADWVADVMVEVTSVGKCVMVVILRFESECMDY
jgi:hypothetical protein